MRRLAIVLALPALLLAAICSAQQTPTTAVPDLIRYGGTLKDAQGSALSSTAIGMSFAIYKQQDGGAPVWMETQNVATDSSGNYSVLLGSTTATGLPGDLFSQQEQRWLSVQVEGEAEQPRVLLVSVPYAFKAHEAETLAGKSVSDFVLADSANTTGTGSNTSQALPSSVNNPPARGIRKGAASDGPTNFSGSTTDQIVGVTQSGAGVGVNASAPSKGVVGTATATSGTVIGVEGGSAGSGGYGVYGNVSSSTGATVGVKGNSTSTSGTGVRGTNTATTGATTGVSGYVASSSGIAGAFNNAAGGKILSGQNNGVETFSVNGSGTVNSASGTYQAGGSSVVSIGSPADDNLFLGVGAGAQDVAGSGVFNTFSGFQAGFSNTGGQSNTFYGQQAGFSNTTGKSNVFSGKQAGYSNTTGNSNTFHGVQAGYGNTTGGGNTFLGVQAGYSNSTGTGSTFSGTQAGYSNTTGDGNTFSGQGAGYSNTTACCNTFAGQQAGMNTTTGGTNVFYGYQAGYDNTSGSFNVYISNQGPTSGTESNTIRIGNVQTATYIAGIEGSISPSGMPVYINFAGQLGTQTSSRRFKEQIQDMGESTSALMKLRPVTFFYKPEYSKGDRTLQYGLIAEEVAQVYPELVAYDNDGQPYSVRYQYITTMLLNEVQKQYRKVEELQADLQVQNAELKKQNEDLQQRLARVETLLQSLANSATAQTASAASPQPAGLQR